MANKYNRDDAFAELEEFYGENLGLEDTDVDVPAIINKYGAYYSKEDRDYLDELDKVITKDSLTYGEDDPVEYVENIVFDLTDEAGNTSQYEMIGRVDIEERTYIVLHRMNDEDKSSLVALRAWDDENGQLVATEITDEDEAKEVYEQVSMLLSDYDDSWEDIPGGGVQWDE